MFEDPTATLDQLAGIYDPSYQTTLLMVEDALAQAQGLQKPTSVSAPENELELKLLELIDSVPLE